MFAYLRELFAHSGGALFGVLVAAAFVSALMLVAFDALVPVLQKAFGYDLTNPFAEALRNLDRIFGS
jgi:hypothetical protein